MPLSSGFTAAEVVRIGLRGATELQEISLVNVRTHYS